MPITDPIKRKEYARLSMAIKKAHEQGNDPTELLTQRKDLIQGIKSESIKGINEPGINNTETNQFIPFIPKQRYKKSEYKTSLELFDKIFEVSNETQQLVNQLHEELTAFRSEFREHWKIISGVNLQPRITRKKTYSRKSILSAESKAELARLTAGLVKGSKEWWRIYNQLPERKEYNLRYNKKRQPARVKKNS